MEIPVSLEGSREDDERDELDCNDEQIDTNNLSGIEEQNKIESIEVGDRYLRPVESKEEIGLD